MYLYFYVGDYSQTAIEQTAGLNSSLFNDKADVDLSNCTKPHIVETYVNGTSWYRVYSDGWCEQGGVVDLNVSGTINLLKNYIDINYTVTMQTKATAYTYQAAIDRANQTVSSFIYLFNVSDVGSSLLWEAKGYIW
jgi:hypothetical protein